MKRKYSKNDESLEDRLLARRRITEKGCWEWAGGTIEGYGIMWWQDGCKRVHRLSAMLYLGLGPNSKLNVLHKNECHNTLCFNPAHLYLGTQLENNRDVIDFGNNFHINKTHCGKGHEFTKENTYVKTRKDGRMYRNCITCAKAFSKKFYQIYKNQKTEQLKRRFTTET